MKTLILILTLAMPSASDDTYVEVMQQNMEKMRSAQTVEELNAVLNTYERIRSVNPEKWEVYYYAAFTHIMIANHKSQNSDKDALYSEAVKQMDKALKLELTPEARSEILALKGFILMIGINLDPMQRGPERSPQIMGIFQQAMQLDPANPRAVHFMALMQNGMAQFMGSDTSEACNLNSQSLGLFENFAPEYPLRPRWGKDSAERFAANCTSEN